MGGLLPRIQAASSFVRADRTVSYAALIDVLGLVNRAGFGKVWLVAETDLSK
jgi:biopolymer transport protein ExbD